MPLHAIFIQVYVGTWIYCIQTKNFRCFHKNIYFNGSIIETIAIISKKYNPILPKVPSKSFCSPHEKESTLMWKATEKKVWGNRELLISFDETIKSLFQAKGSGLAQNVIFSISSSNLSAYCLSEVKYIASILHSFMRIKTKTSTHLQIT